MKELQETIELMNSEDYKARFIAEYWQTKIRYDKLCSILIKERAGKLDFTPACGFEILEDQKYYMNEYLNTLKVRAEIEGIDLENIV